MSLDHRNNVGNKVRVYKNMRLNQYNLTIFYFINGPIPPHQWSSVSSISYLIPYQFSFCYILPNKLLQWFGSLIESLIFMPLYLAWKYFGFKFRIKFCNIQNILPCSVLVLRLPALVIYCNIPPTRHLLISCLSQKYIFLKYEFFLFYCILCHYLFYSIVII